MVAVQTGALIHKHRLVPTSDAQVTENGLTVPYDKDTVESSPDASDIGDTLDGDFVDQVRAHYEGNRVGDAAVDAAVPVRTVDNLPDDFGKDADAETVQTNRRYGDVRDAGDYIEVPVIEERLVKQRVVTEVLRVKKTSLADIAQSEQPADGAAPAEATQATNR
jgi:hypothetical protein